MSIGNLKNKNLASNFEQLGKYFFLILALGIVAFIGKLMMPLIGYHSVGFIFLVFVLLASLFSNLYQILFCTILSALVWDVFFIPPFGTFLIDAPQDIFMCVSYFSAAFVTGFFTTKIRSREHHLEFQKNEVSLLYNIAKTISSSPSQDLIYKSVFSKLREYFQCDFCILKIEENKVEIEYFDSSFWGDYLNDKFNYADLLMVPFESLKAQKVRGLEILLFKLRNTGTTNRVVLIHKMKDSITKEINERALKNCLNQLSFHLEREFLEEQAVKAKRLQESELIYHTILDCISHELKTPITTIQGVLNTLGKPQISKSAEVINELTKDGLEASKRLNNTVNDLLDMSRIESGYLEIQPALYDAKDLIDHCLNSLNDSVIRDRIAIDIPSTVSTIFADLSLLQKAISNLILNAIKFSPKQSKIDLGISQTSNHVEIYVKDEGPGVPECEQTKIFEKFYQIHNSKNSGTGLGLSLVSGIAKAHQGYVKCISEGANGSKFIIGLPFLTTTLANGHEG